MCALARARGCAIGLLSLIVLGLNHADAQRSTVVRGDPQHGRELFERVWQPGSMPEGGDGLGPMFNERSCVACHFLGGIGGAGPNQNNVDLLTALPPKDANDRWWDNLGLVHPGLARVTSVMLHKFSTSANYAEFRGRVLGRLPSSDVPQRHTFVVNSTLAQDSRRPIIAIGKSRAKDGVTLVLTQRNTTAMFGAGLIDKIAADIIQEVATQQQANHPKTAGTFVGRFGWRGDVSDLGAFVRGACAAELGLNSPGIRQSFNPQHQMERSWGLDLTEQDCVDVTEYIASLPRPWQVLPTDDKRRIVALHGESLFKSIGCAVCHLPTLASIPGIYSDLLVHDLGPRLEDPFGSITSPSNPTIIVQGYYGSGRTPGATPPPPPPALVKNVRRWKTPPLWGLRDSAPYLHDGRAATVDEAIRWHGGQALGSQENYRALSESEREAILAFLSTLVAREPAATVAAAMSRR